MYRDRSRPAAVNNNNFGGGNGYTPSSFNSYNNKSSASSGGYTPSSFNGSSNNNNEGYTPSAYGGSNDNGVSGYNASGSCDINDRSNSSSSSRYTEETSNSYGNNSSSSSHVEAGNSAVNNSYISPKQHGDGMKDDREGSLDSAETYSHHRSINTSPVPTSSSSVTSHNSDNKYSINNDTTPDRSKGNYIPVSKAGNKDSSVMNTVSSSSSVKPMDEENINVVIRVRPLRSHEKEKGETSCVKIRDRVGTAGGAPISQEVQVSLGPLEAQVFSCKKCFSSNTSQDDVFSQSGITSLLDSSVEGYRACAFAFGQTGAGKTYTVIGPSNSISPGSESDGLLGRSIGYMYDKVEATRYNDE